MKYLLIISLLILSGCNTGKKLVNLNEKSVKKDKTEKINLLDSGFKKMSFDEFDAFLTEYSKNSNYPDINQ